MTNYNFRFVGRQTGSIGCFYNISRNFTANSLGEAKTMLYEHYEHISELKIREGKKGVSIEHFNEVPFVATT